MLNIIKLSRNKIPQSAISAPFSTASVTLKNVDGLKEAVNEFGEKLARKEYTWRNKYSTPAKKPLLPLSPDNAFFRLLQADVQLTPAGIKKLINEKLENVKKGTQEFNETRTKILGADLALAHVIIYQGGKVKFKGHDEWMDLEKTKTAILPDMFNPDYIVAAVDASEIKLYYEVLENFRNVSRIKELIFKKSPLFNDWYLDKLTGLLPQLEYLDISDTKVTERGLIALYKTPNLKTLIVTNNDKTSSFELTCLMLQDILPKLKIDIIVPKEKRKPTINPIE